jgi:hypothetical protein
LSTECYPFVITSKVTDSAGFAYGAEVEIINAVNVQDNETNEAYDKNFKSEHFFSVG